MCGKVAVSLLMIAGVGGCKTGASLPNEPGQGLDLIANPTFESHGSPSLAGWITTDSAVVQFSASLPPGGSGWTILLRNRLGPAPVGLYNSVYTTIMPPIGTYACRLSLFGRKEGEAGGVVALYVHRFQNGGTDLLGTLSINNTNWMLCATIDTLNARPGDTVVVLISGGSGEYSGSTYVNTCKFEKLQ